MEAVKLSAVTPLEASTAGVLLDRNWTKMEKHVKVSVVFNFKTALWEFYTFYKCINGT